MEALNDWKIREFLSTSSGYGSGDGSGYGSGYGYGYSSGYGYGDGSGSGSGYGYDYGDGSGYGSGSGDGNGYGIQCVNGDILYIVDNIPTRIDKIKSQIAKGAIFNRDLTFTPCYVAKYNGFWGHGDSAREALKAAIEKYEEQMPEEDRIRAFVDAHKPEIKYPNQDFFVWHHKLTGSCEMGRKAFARDHEIGMDESMTVLEFIKLTENDYGGDIIKKLKPFYVGEDKT